MENKVEVEKEPLYRVKIGKGYFVEYQERGALIIPDGNKEIKIFNSKSDAELTAQTIGGTLEEVADKCQKLQKRGLNKNDYVFITSKPRNRLYRNGSIFKR